MRKLLFLFMLSFVIISCGFRGNYVTFKSPSLRQLGKCEPWQQKMFVDYCEGVYYDSDVGTKLKWNRKGRKNLYQQHILILGYPPDTTATYDQFGGWMKK